MIRFATIHVCIAFWLLIAAALGWAQSAAADNAVRVSRDLEYGRVGATSLKLDLYVPASAKSAAPVVVWVHGGAWRSGSKINPPLLPLVARGYALASIDYRLSPVAPFPAQVHDIKGAIRYLRATAKQHGIRAEKVAIAGGSAGGHLAALVGTSGGVKELEGDVGGHADQSSAVDGIVVFYGASNLATILAQSTPHGLRVREPALELLLGGPPDSKPDLVRLASPVFHVDRSEAPLLWYHGDQDPQMPINQAHELVGAYQKEGARARLEVVYGGGHGGKLFYTPEQMQQVGDFLVPILLP